MTAGSTAEDNYAAPQPKPQMQLARHKSTQDPTIWQRKDEDPKKKRHNRWHRGDNDRAQQGDDDAIGSDSDRTTEQNPHRHTKNGNIASYEPTRTLVTPTNAAGHHGGTNAALTR